VRIGAVHERHEAQTKSGRDRIDRCIRHLDHAGFIGGQCCKHRRRYVDEVGPIPGRTNHLYPGGPHKQVQVTTGAQTNGRDCHISSSLIGSFGDPFQRVRARDY